jgi:glutamine cyclotransferase
MKTLIGLACVTLMSMRAIGFAPQSPLASGLPTFGYEVVRSYPHDPGAFTQGLQYLDGFLYEGTGLIGRSSIRKVKLETGEVLQKRDVSADYFGEGITVFGNDLIELTWQNHLAFVYDKTTFEPKKRFSYPGEGWGLTSDGTNLIMSDGTAELRILDPLTFVEKQRIKVIANGVPLQRLNEIEFMKGEVLANIWLTDTIARIALGTGRVTGMIDLRGLLSPAERAQVQALGGVLNGIAYDAEHDRLFVTGKLWPKLFEIKLVRK